MIRIILKLILLIISLANFFPPGFAKQAILTIEKNKKLYYFSRDYLLNHYAIFSITMKTNRAYPGIKINYTAIKLCQLLKPFNIKQQDVLELIALDQFSVLIPADKLITCKRNAAIAFLAIEPLDKWPPLKNTPMSTAGPFDIIWLFPEKSYISNEYWAWSVVKIIVHEQLTNAIIISKPIIQDKKTQRGYEVYVSHCAGCHSINFKGKGKIGPDLNWPKNPVEYYSNDKILKKFIRDPQSVRQIENSRMSGSEERFLNNADLNDLIRYFHYMAKHKV